MHVDTRPGNNGHRKQDGTNREVLTFALPKGRLFSPTVDLLEKAGMATSGLIHEGRELVVEDEDSGFRFLLVRPADVVTYAENGVADLGITGKDVLMENGGEVMELLDLGLGFCRVVVAGPADRVRTGGGKIMDAMTFYRETGHIMRVATKFPRIAREYMESTGVPAQIIKLRGSVELGPLTGLADLIVDLVSTGRTLAANGLVEMDRVAEVTARLIANPVSYRVKNRRVRELVCRLRGVIESPQATPSGREK